MAPLKILITGAGIAGTTLAYLLVRQGHDVTVVERFPTLRTSGLQIDLRGPGIDIVMGGRMGDEIPGAFRAAACPEQGLRFVDKRGKVWGYFPANKYSAGGDDGGGEDEEDKNKEEKKKKKKIQGFTTDFEIMRGDFCRLLYEAANREAAGRKGNSGGGGGGKVEWCFGTWVESYYEEEDEGKGKGKGKVEVRFANGKKEMYDLVIGADGQGSRLRRMMAKEKRSSPSFANKEEEEAGGALLSLDQDESFVPCDGEYEGYYTMRIPEEEEEEEGEGEKGAKTKRRDGATTFMAPGRGILMRRNKPGVEQVYLIGFGRGENHPLVLAHRGRDVAAQKAALAEQYQDTEYHRMGTLLRGLHDAEDFHLERFGLVKLDRWSSSGGRVVLAGDAAHCPSAKTGMGTTSAVTGSYILAGEIGRSCGLLEEEEDEAVGNGVRRSQGDGLKTAVQMYEQRFRPFMDQVQKGLPEEPGFMTWMLETKMGIFLMYCIVSVASFFKVDILSKFILREDVKDWELPEYGPVKKAS